MCETEDLRIEGMYHVKSDPLWARDIVVFGDGKECSHLHTLTTVYILVPYLYLWQ